MKTELQERADILTVNLQRSMDACFEVLRSIAQFYGSSEAVERQDFQRFVQPALVRHPGIHALEWLPRLSNAERAQFEQAVQTEGYSSFQVTERTADQTIIRARLRSEYFPVLYVEPMETNELALGFDLASDATRRSALEKARDQGTIVASGRIELVQATEKQFGFLVILPIYRQGNIPDTLAERREHLQGFVLGVFRVADIVRAALPGLDLENIDLYLYDKSDRPRNSFLAAYRSQSKQVSASPDQETMGVEFTWRVSTQGRLAVNPTRRQAQKNICIRSFNIGDRQWSLLLQPTTAYVDHAELYEQSRIRADAATAQAQRLQQALQNLQPTRERWFLEKKLIALGVGLALLVFGGANAVSYRNLMRLMASKTAAEQSYAAIAGLAKVLSSTTDASAPSPATLLETADAPELDEPVAALRQTIALDAAQQQRLNQLEPLIAQRLALLTTESPITSQTSTPSVTSELDHQLQQQIRQLVADMEHTERSRLQYWQEQATYSARNIVWMAIAGISLSFALLVGVYYLLQRQMTERQAIEVALFEVNNQLETEVKERMAELAQTREMSELKLRLFSMVSHEFRTPLSTILVSTQSLAHSHTDWSEDRKTKNLLRIQAAAKTMAQLLTDILTLNRAEAGKLEFRPELLNLEQFCQHLIEEIQLSTGRQQAIDFFSHGHCYEAHVDGKLLHSILANLLTNAIKYSPAASLVKLTLTCTSDSIAFEIQDQGIGIPTEDQPQLYEAFYRGQNVGDVAGTGLGLAVVKTCVDRHGGQIAVQSQVGAGTTFTVTLPQS